MAEATSANPRPTSTDLGQLPLDQPGQAPSANLGQPQPTSTKSAEGPSKCTDMHGRHVSAACCVSIQVDWHTVAAPELAFPNGTHPPPRAPPGYSSPMLILLFVVHSLSKQSRVAQGHTLELRATTDTCNDINNCRRLFDIACGCLTTIFACTWVSVHPNVPPPNLTWMSRFGRRLGMMLVAVIAPEFLAARAYAKEFGVSQTHGFFISMGGFLEYIQDMLDLDAEDLMDKSKGDALSKGVAVAQGLWFTTQYLARIHQRLPVTEIEVATLAFAVVNIFIWLLWWNKPFDVARPLPIGPKEATPVITNTYSYSRPQPWWKGLRGSLLAAFSGYTYELSELSTAVPAFWSDECDVFTDPTVYLCATTEALVGILFGGIHSTAWNAQFLSVAEIDGYHCSITVPI
ncbi:hypothetical protein B0H14DRAFT_3483473 [Mycena olivaceomarginata]|nr:hypothetical protein B0H14DRAFT_3483473 [Mycena olivaceomarginata]